MSSKSLRLQEQTDVPLVNVQPGTPVKLPSGSQQPDLDESSSSLLTHSDKLSALPSPSPSRARIGTFSRARVSEPSLPWDTNNSAPQIQARVSGESSDREGKETPKQRVSFDSVREGSSLPSFQNVRQAAARIVRSPGSSEHAHSSPPPEPPRRGSNDSHSPSRNQSPLGRILWPLHRLHSREEPFIPLDPYRFALAHGLDQIARQIYRHLLLRLPSVYFSRVCRLFEDADISRPEIQRMIEGVARGEEFPKEWNPPAVSPALARFKDSWEEFVAQVLREWKTLNVVSALLLSAILTMFQITDAANDPITRTSALFSLIAALWSLSFGCTYIIRFGTMKSMYKASRWAEEAQKTKTSIWWNVWVLLAVPAVWLAWSMIAFCVSILAFVWRTGSSTDNPQPLPPRQELGPRIAVTCLFALGFVYFILIVRTFKAYGGGRPRGTYINMRNVANAAMASNAGGALALNEVIASTQRVSENTTFSTDLEKGKIMPQDRGRRVSPRL